MPNFLNCSSQIASISTKVLFWLYFKVLIANAVDVDAVDNHGWTALYAASSSGDGDIVRALIAAGNKKTNQRTNVHCFLVSLADFTVLQASQNVIYILTLVV